MPGFAGYPGGPGEKGDKGSSGKHGSPGEKGDRVRKIQINSGKTLNFESFISREILELRETEESLDLE